MTPNNYGASNSKTHAQTLIVSICICFFTISLIITVIVLSLIVSKTPAITTVKLSDVQKQLQQITLTWQVNYDTQDYADEGNELKAIYQIPEVRAVHDRANTDNTEEEHLEASQNRIQNLLSQLRNRKTKIPTYFDARERWPECPQTRRVYDQAGCGSCWAISSSSMITDRTCIATEFKFQEYVSAYQLIFCCPQCGQCAGGDIGPALKYWSEEGLVTEQCMPYAFAPTCGSPCKASMFVESTLKVEQLVNKTATNQQCPKTCTDGELVKIRHRGAQFYKLKTMSEESYYDQYLTDTTKETMRNANNSETNFLEKFKGRKAKGRKIIDLFILKKKAFETSSTSSSRVQESSNTRPKPPKTKLKRSADFSLNDKDTQNDLFKLEMMERGPVVSCFYVSEDLFYYKSGIYSHTTGDIVYEHCVKVIGWGQDKTTKQNYWTMSNSWGKNWGENGFGRIAMIEESNKEEIPSKGDLMLEVIAGVVRN